MSDIATFSKRLHDVVADDCRVRHWTVEEARFYMNEIGERRRSFEEKATSLLDHVIQPRLTTVAGLFPNASCEDEESAFTRSCHFQWSSRFPTLASIAFSVEHDVRIEQLRIHSRAWMMPRFTPLVEQDHLRSPLKRVEEAKVSDWVEERLLEFIDTYLRLDCRRQDVTDVATDPVCGMKLSVAEADAMSSYYGHPYYFCSEGCLKLFEKDPAQYAQVKTI